tara:strand:- start:26 stop:730 length:705 start_codon:yes stop_codon:yes gene_type:complete
MSKSIIVARFNEDISWLKPYKDFNLMIYNKGSDLPNPINKNIIKIKNVGRESHTWLFHIVNNYNNLDDINIFLQGRIDDLGCMAYKNPYQYLKQIDKYGFAVSRYGILGPYHWKWHVGIDKDIRYKKKWENESISRSNIGFRSFAKKLFPEIPWIIATSYGGCFAVKKELIRSYNLSFYKSLLDILSSHKDPIEGHYMERLWCYMFTKNKPIFESFFHVIKTKLERLKLKKMLN